MDRSTELKRCVQALAQPAAVQRALFPSFAVVGDELVLEFDDALRGWRAEQRTATEAQLATLSELECLIEHLSGPLNEDFWLDPVQLDVDARWEDLRLLARAACAAFGWPVQIPDKNGAVYVNATTTVRNG